MAVTNAQLLEAYREALLALATAQSYSMLGKTVTKASIPDIMKAISVLESKVAAETNPGDALGIVQITN